MAGTSKRFASRFPRGLMTARRFVCAVRASRGPAMRRPVTLAEAAMGATIDVPTPQGTISLKVPPNTSSGTRLRVKGHGVRPANGPAGDLFAEIEIELPKNLTAEERQQLADISGRYPQK